MRLLDKLPWPGSDENKLVWERAFQRERARRKATYKPSKDRYSFGLGVAQKRSGELAENYLGVTRDEIPDEVKEEAVAWTALMKALGAARLKLKQSIEQGSYTPLLTAAEEKKLEKMIKQKP